MGKLLLDRIIILFINQKSMVEKNAMLS